MDSSFDIKRSHSINDAQKEAIDVNEAQKNDQNVKFLVHGINPDNSEINAALKMSRIEKSPSFWEQLSIINKTSCACSCFCCSFIVCLLIYSTFMKA